MKKSNSSFLAAAVMRFVAVVCGVDGSPSVAESSGIGGISVDPEGCCGGGGSTAGSGALMTAQRAKSTNKMREREGGVGVGS